jgi:hypothetical protein
MKFLAIIALSLSLLTSSTFAVSLTPPQVYAIKEDRSMASNVDASDTFNPLKALVAGTSIGLTIGGLLFVIVGCSSLGNNSQADKTLMTVGGVGMMGLGITGMVWSF